jgi:predicted metal-dependent hydrolase
LPGRDPHPTRDPQGHSYASEPAAPAAYHASEAWRSNEDYLYGVDLYNHGFLWEAHEVWEGAWHASKHDVVQADFLQGLIQCSAAALKVPMKQPRGLERLAALGTERLERVARASGGEYMGLDLDAFVAAFRRFAAARPQDARERPLLALEI